ncbi:MAG: NACHT domain-containing NTPase, partial [Gammaproteobacteria bacterium]
MKPLYSKASIQTKIKAALKDRPFDINHYFFLSREIWFQLAEELLRFDNDTHLEITEEDAIRYQNNLSGNDSITLKRSLEELRRDAKTHGGQVYTPLENIQAIIGWEQPQYLTLHLLFLLHEYLRYVHRVNMGQAETKSDIKHDADLIDFLLQEITTTVNAYLLLDYGAQIDFNDPEKSQQQIEVCANTIVAYTHADDQMLPGEELVFACGVPKAHAIYLSLKKIEQHVYVMRIDNAGAGSETSELFANGTVPLPRVQGIESDGISFQDVVVSANQWRVQFKDEAAFKSILIDYLRLIYGIYQEKLKPEQLNNSEFVANKIAQLQRPVEILEKLQNPLIAQEKKVINDYPAFPKQSPHNCVSHGFMMGSRMRLYVRLVHDTDKQKAIFNHLKSQENSFANMRDKIRHEGHRNREIYLAYPPYANALEDEKKRWAEQVPPSITPPISLEYINAIKNYYRNQQGYLKLLINPNWYLPISSGFISLSDNESKTSILKPCDLLKSKRVLIMAEPGKGKSTFCQYIAHEWACDYHLSSEKGEELGSQLVGKNAFKFIFWINLAHLLKDEKVLQAQISIQEIAAQYIADSIFDETVINHVSIEEWVKVFLQVHNDSLFICDGLDEIIEGLSSIRINNKVYKLFLYFLNQPNVILTTRFEGKYWLSETRRVNKFDQQVTLTGFSAVGVKKYVSALISHRNLNDKDAVSEKNKIDKQTLVYNQIASEPNLREICETPLFCELVCSILVDNIDEFDNITNNISELYKRMEAYLYKHYFRKHDNLERALIKHKGNKIEWILIHPDIVPARASIQNIAWQAIHNLHSKAEINGQNIETWIKDNIKVDSSTKLKNSDEEALNIFGQIMERLTLIRDKTKKNEEGYFLNNYEFLHASLQEMCAGNFLANAIIKRSKTCNWKVFLRKSRYDVWYEMTLRFCVGYLATLKDKKYLIEYFDCINHPNGLDVFGNHQIHLLAFSLNECAHLKEISKGEMLYVFWDKVINCLKTDSTDNLKGIEKYSNLLTHSQDILFKKAKTEKNSYLLNLLSYIPDVTKERFSAIIELIGDIGCLSLRSSSLKRLLNKMRLSDSNLQYLIGLLKNKTVDQDNWFWFQKSQKHLAKALASTNYSTENQFNQLLAAINDSTFLVSRTLGKALASRIDLNAEQISKLINIDKSIQYHIRNRMAKNEALLKIINFDDVLRLLKDKSINEENISRIIKTLMYRQDLNLNAYQSILDSFFVKQTKISDINDNASIILNHIAQYIQPTDHDLLTYLINKLCDKNIDITIRADAIQCLSERSDLELKHYLSFINVLTEEYYNKEFKARLVKTYYDNGQLTEDSFNQILIFASAGKLFPDAEMIIGDALVMGDNLQVNRYTELLKYLSLNLINSESELQAWVAYKLASKPILMMDQELFDKWISILQNPLTSDKVLREVSY